MSVNTDSILEILDDGVRNFEFPMLDNGYYYLAGTRLSLYRSASDWAMAFETFGFSPRAGRPDINVTTFGSNLTQRKSEADFVSAQAYQQYIQSYPYNVQSFYHPIDDDMWIDPENGEALDVNATKLVLRGKDVLLPSRNDYLTAGVILEDPSLPRVFEMCRALAFSQREKILATKAEREAQLPHGAEPLLILDEWHHPDVVDPSALPSKSATFQQLAAVLASGDVSIYRPIDLPNTHWSNWPDGGTL